MIIREGGQNGPTAGHIQGAGLLVQGEQGQVHRAGAGDGDPAILMMNTLL